MDEAVKHANDYHLGDPETQQWVDEVLENTIKTESGKPVDERQCSVSRIFRHITDRMAYYWRQDPRLEDCMTSLHGIARRRRRSQAG
jgi:hypothetical protein